MLRLFTIFFLLLVLGSGAFGDAGQELKYPLLAEPDAAPPTSPGAAPIVTEPLTGDIGNDPVITMTPADNDPPLVTTESAGLPAKPANSATGSATGRPIIALIIDDLGNQRIPGERTVALHGPVACAIMPHTSHAGYLAERAYAAGKEVMLHLPMQSVEMLRVAGPGEISLDNGKQELSRILQSNLDSVPHTVGINNHMGSLLTRHPGHMHWLMEELSRRGNLFFIDSYTTPLSVAYQIALEKGVPAARRHVFLDNEATADQVARQFQRLKRQAERQGYAIGIGHPYPATLTFLEQALPLLDEQGFRLVSVTTIIKMQQAPHLHTKANPAMSIIPEVANSVF